jgi:hypothetical protein
MIRGGTRMVPELMTNTFALKLADGSEHGTRFDRAAVFDQDFRQHSWITEPLEPSPER